jgi:2-oxo-4-hydroxy-4-carboxy-5-ureidoimidazoline decarboxylase
MAELGRTLSALAVDERAEALARCCGARRWVALMEARAPYADAADVHRAADAAFAALGRDDWLEAFGHHPQIGASLEALRARFPSTARWSGGEQAQVLGTSEATLRALADGNAAYLARFGYIFIVCATGKSAEEMLALLEVRLRHAPDTELSIAAAEQIQITHLRLDKLAAEVP